MRTIKLWLTTIATLLCCLAANAHDFEVDGIYYDITSSTDLTVEVTYRGNYSDHYSNEYSGAVTIPSTVTYNSKTYSVTSIGNSAFYSCSSLTSITIPEGVTSIGSYAFSDCSSLTSITIPESVTSIGGSAFSDCSSLTSITIPEGVTSIGDYAFQHCSSLTSINIPESVTSIGDYAFQYCSSLTSINIPESVTSIGSYAFYNCSSLYKVINYSNLSLSKGSSRNGYVAYYAKVVYKGSDLTTVDDFQFYTSDGIHALVNYIGNDAEIVLLDSYNGENYKIGNYAFSGCSSLTSITIPEGVTSIGSYAFSDCSSLTSITIPEGVTSIGNNAFSDCSSLTSITIPEGVTSIGNNAFSSCFNLISITIPESVTSIGNCAFDNCTSLKELIIGDGSTTLSLGYNYYYSNAITGQGLFYDCPLEEVYLGRNLSYSSGSSYGYSPFYNNTKLTTLTIGDSVTSIGNNTFANCTALKKVIIEDGCITLSLGYNNYNSSNTGQSLFYDCPLEEVYLGRNLSYSSGSWYGYSPFYNKDALTNVAIGNEVTKIGQDAFRYCDNIHSLTIPNGVLSIGSNAFSTPDKVIWLTNTPPTGYANAKGSINYVANDQYASLSNTKVYPYLSSMFEVDGVKYVPVSPSERTCHAIDCAYDSTATIINVSETASFKGVAMKVTEVMPYTFYDNDHIKEVSVSHLGNIGNYAFCDCDAIETVTLGDSIGSLGDKAFYQCSSLQEIVIPDHVKSVGAYCFSGCSAMTNVALGRSITTINSYAFQNCSSLPEITLPQTVTKVDDYVFAGCSKLADVIIEDRTTALVLGSNGSSPLFADCPLDSVYIGGKITYNNVSSTNFNCL